MTEPAADAVWRSLRRKFLFRTLVACIWIAWFTAYLLGVLFGFDQSEIIRSFMVTVPLAVVLNALVQQYLLAGPICRDAVTERPGDVPGARLTRLLALPRRLELFAMLPSFTSAGILFSTVSCIWFHKSWSLAPPAVAIVFSISLLIGLPATLQFQEDVLPWVLEEYRKHPHVRPNGRGATWTRQAWYLPYSFALLIANVLAAGAVVLTSGYRVERDRLVAAVRGKGPEEVLALIGQGSERLAAATLLPLGIICSALLVTFVVSGLMMARRQRRASSEIEDSLRALAGGSPSLPKWVGTDEMGDVAFSLAGVSSDMRNVFEQLQKMAAGNLSVDLKGESGLIHAFRESQQAMLLLTQRMNALSRGERIFGGTIPGELGEAFARLSEALDGTVTQAKTIAQGDLRTEQEISGELGVAITQMTINLRRMVGQTKEVGAKVGDIVVALRAASAQLSTATTEQVSALAETANTMTEMSQTSAASADRCAELIRQGDAAATVVDEGKAGAREAERAVEAISASLGKVADASSTLAQKVQQVDGIIETVSFLADQSSTLAINAGIEASRAGESGRGFAAVAREMRSLASDSRKATGQIREILQEIRQKTALVDSTVAAGASTIDQGAQLVSKLGEIVSQLGTTIHEAVVLIRQVEGAARQHQAGVSQVTSALRSMQGGSEAIRDGARTLSSMSEQATSLATQLKASAEVYQLPGPAKPDNNGDPRAANGRAVS